MKKMTLLVGVLFMCFCFAQCTGQKNSTDQADTEQKVDTAQKSDVEIIYIIMFKMDATGNFEQEANKILQQANVSSDKVQYYYSSIKGVAVKLTAKQAQKMEQNPNVTSIEADQQIKVDLPKPEGKQ